MKLKSQLEIVLAVFIVVLATWTAIDSYKAFNQQTDWARVPSMSIEQLVQGRNQLLQQIAKPTNAADYFQILKRFRELEDAAAKQEETGTNRFVLMHAGVGQVVLTGYERDFVNAWQSRVDNMGSAIYAYSQAHPETVALIGQMPTLPREQWRIDRFWQVFKCLFILPLPLCICLYVLRIQEDGGNVLLEVFNWRFLLSSVLWMYGLPYYRNMDFKYQVRRCKQVASLCLCSSLSCFAAAAGAKPEVKNPGKKTGNSQTWSLDATTSTVSDYVGGNDKVFHIGPVQQSSLKLTAPNGTYVSAFGSIPYVTKRSQEDSGYETDFSAGWSGGYKRFSFNTSATYLNLAPLAHSRGDTLGLSFTLGRTLKFGRDTLTPYTTFNHYLPIVGGSPKTGTFSRFGANNSLPLGKWSASSGLELMYDNGAFGNSPTWIAKASAGISRSIGRHLQLSLPVNFGTPLAHVTDGRKSEITYGLSFNCSFAH